MGEAEGEKGRSGLSKAVKTARVLECAYWCGSALLCIANFIWEALVDSRDIIHGTEDINHSSVLYGATFCFTASALAAGLAARSIRREKGLFSMDPALTLVFTLLRLIALSLFLAFIMVCSHANWVA